MTWQPAENLRGRAGKTDLILPADLTIEEWVNVGKNIGQLTSSSAWWIGDWINFGEKSYPDRYRRALSETMLDYQTLRNYAWIARRFPPARRRAEVSFQHHMEVAALPTGYQDHWLTLAARFGWSRNELRRQIRASACKDDQWQSPQDIDMRLSIGEERIARWRTAAEQDNMNLTEWMVMVLDDASDQAGSA